MASSEMGKRLPPTLSPLAARIRSAAASSIFLLPIFRTLRNRNEEVRYNNGDADLKRRKGWVYVGRRVCKAGRMMMMMMMM